MADLKGTKTEKNLMEAFKGESQARNKYDYYASQARKDGYEQIAEIFEETAKNEKEHAKLWFKYLHEGIIPDTKTNLKDAGISKIEIERNPKRCEVIINTSKPGVVIGRGGEGITKLKSELKTLVGEDIQVSIADVKDIDLNAQLVAQSIATQIENRAPFRVAEKKAIRNAMKAGAKGIKTLVSGRLNGVEMARSEGYSEGNIPLHTIRADIDYGFAEALTTYGKLGVKVWIYKGEILPAKAKKGGNN